MKTYQINDLERLTGIKAHTIRIWEKRYSLICPNRTDTNRRYYDDEQVKRLLNVTTLLSKGHKISKIASYSESEMKVLVETQESVSTEALYAGYVNDLIAAMLAFDEAGFEKVFSASLLKMGLFDTMINIIYPFLLKSGVLWTVDKTAPVQEHFTSAIIKRKLMSATDSLSPSPGQKTTFLLFLPPGEWHEVAILFANYIIRSRGYKTIYLAQDVPVDGMNDVIEKKNPQYLLTFFVAARPEEETLGLIRRYVELAENAKLLIAGSLPHAAKTRFPEVAYLSNIDAIFDWL
jgi:DNA-binding transcriptional MerR regulator